MAPTSPKPKPPAKGLVLELGGAPATPHWIPGVPGLFVPGVATVIGGPGEVTPEYGAEIDADPAVPLRLVDVDADDVPRLREVAAANHRANRGGVRASRKTARGLEVAHVRDATDHTTTTGAVS